MLTEQELEARKHAIGASDMAAIMGLPTFAGVNAYSVWLDKTNQLEPESGNQSTDAGNLLEPVLLDWAEQQLGTLRRNVRLGDVGGAPLAATLDAQIATTLQPVEAKTSGIVGPLHGQWGEPGGDDVPENYLVQCMTQILCANAECCHLVALLGGRGFVRFRVNRDDDLVQLIRNVAADFWERHVKTRRDPRAEWADRLHKIHGIEVEVDPTAAYMPVVRRIRRQSGKTCTMQDCTLVDQWRAAQQARLEAQKAEESLKAEMLAQLGDAEEAELPDGRRLVCREEGGPPSYDREAMERDGVWEKYATPGKRRVPRIKQAD